MNRKDLNEVIHRAENLAKAMDAPFFIYLAYGDYWILDFKVDSPTHKLTAEVRNIDGMSRVTRYNKEVATNE